LDGNACVIAIVPWAIDIATIPENVIDALFPLFRFVLLLDTLYT